MSRFKMKQIIVPGYQGSPEGHWQFWLNGELNNSEMVVQDDFDFPKMDEWVTRLEEVIDQCNEPVQLIAHSLGCITVVKWALKYNTAKVDSVVLVAPADVESSYLPKDITGFGTIPQHKLPFKTTVIGSHNDPYMSIERVRLLANSWSATFVDAGFVGHINTASGFGPWPDLIPIIEAAKSSKDLFFPKNIHSHVA